MSTNGIPLEEMTLRQLRKVASEYGVSRYSRMRKEQLVQEIQKLQGITTSATPSSPSATAPAQETVEASKFDLGQSATPAAPESATAATKVPAMASLADVDADLADLPDGYGESRIVLLPRDPQWAYVYWDIPNEHRQELRGQGGTRLALRFYDVTNIDINYQRPHSLQQYECDEMAREWYVPIPVSDRDYAVEIGYLANDGRWLVLARSATVRIPPVYPSDWIEDQFVAVDWDNDLRGKTVLELVTPSEKMAAAADENAIYDKVFGMAESTEALRVAGSLFGSMHQVPEQSLSSYVFPSGMGMWSASGMGMTMSGAGMSGVGFGASMPPVQPRKFWLVADAELIVYGATEPDATVTIGDRKIKLNPDGTFRFQMSFQDGLIDYPIKAVAVDGEQTRSVQMKFTRETPERNTNTKAEAVEEWFA